MVALPDLLKHPKLEAMKEADLQQTIKDIEQQGSIYAIDQMGV